MAKLGDKANSILQSCCKSESKVVANSQAIDWTTHQPCQFYDRETSGRWLTPTPVAVQYIRKSPYWQ